MRQIAYVDEDGQVRVRDLDRETDIVVSGRASDQSACSWPTWDPSGRRLAFVRYEIGGGRVRSSTIELTDAEGAAPRRLYRARGIPIYFNWAPSGDRLALLAQEEDSLALRVINLDGPEPAALAAEGSPLYFAWLPDSSGLVANVGGDVLGAVRPRLIWVRLQGEQIASHLLAERPSPGFRTPAWSAALRGMVVATGRRDEHQVGLAVGPDGPVTPLFACGRAPAFVWSPSGQTLACTYRPADDEPYQGIWLYRVQEEGLVQVSDLSPLAFLWCDERRLVCATGPIGDRRVGLRVIDTAGGPDQDLGYVRPSRDLLLLLSHFDQYATSTRLVSPSGEELLVAASRAKEQENGSVPTVRQVLVRRLEAGQPDQVVGRGRVAFWRPATSPG